VTIDECVEEVMSLVRHPAFQETDASRAQFSDLSLRAHVRAALKSDDRTRKMAVQVDVKDGSVTLTGTLERFQEPIHAADVAGAVPGVKGVANQLKLAMPTRAR